MEYKISTSSKPETCNYEWKVLWYPLSNSGMYSKTGLFFQCCSQIYKTTADAVECPFAFLSFSMASLPLLLLLNCPGPHSEFLCGISHSEPLKEQAARGWESCTAWTVFLVLHKITDLPAPFIASTDRQQQNCCFNETQIIHLNHGDGLEQDMLHYHESKYLCVRAYKVMP